ncbi:NADH-quinone oxidoreductase subunit N [Olivibacter ginsenosidimutans]|uniref:NADH-quinone oxidoreductase subunit N n=1 Tax=Olivibacter ginsenosidimutans TaxID=1176537 RepID=A0ABP9AFF0_9SPHI
MKEFIPHISKLLDGVIGGLSFLLPEFVLTLTFLLSIGCGLLFRGKPMINWWVTVIGILLSGWFAYSQIAFPATSPIFFGMILPDTNGAWLKLLIGFTCLLFCFFVYYSQQLRNHPKRIDDLLGILLGVHIGLNLMAVAVNWLMVYLTIEMVSVGSYVMVGYLARDRKQSEAAMKYVLFGTVCSAVMLYGLSLLYGYSGGLSFVDRTQLTALLEMPPLVFIVATFFVLTGIGFKLSFVPFHFWSPDVYQGAPTPVTAFLSTAPKIGAIALLGRLVIAWSTVMETGLPQLLFYILAGIAIGSMLLGNLAAIRQRQVKRMMAYSSIGHTGFLIMIVLAISQQTFPVLFFFLVSYIMMNVGVFMFADYLEEHLGITTVTEYQGLGKSYPMLMVAMTVLMVSLTGLPPTVGFIAKLLSFSAVMEAYQHNHSLSWLLLLITGAVTTVMALFFYFKIPLNAFLRERKREFPPLAYNGLAVLAILLSLMSLVLGFYPSLLGAF